MTQRKQIDPGRLADPAQQSFQLLEDLASAGWYAEVLNAALELDIFARLGAEAHSPEDLAQSLGWDKDALSRLLEALASLGLLVTWDGRFANSPLATRHLVPGAPDFLGDFLAYRRTIARQWQRLPDRVRQGEKANQDAGRDSDEDYATRVLAYVRALDAQARLKAAEAFKKLHLLLEKSPATVLDLGGGAGAWCREALASWPGARAVLLDMPEVIKAARTIYPAKESWQGIEALAGDCRSPELEGRSFDLIVLSNVLHAYGREEAGAMVSRAAGLLAPGGSLLIHDYCKQERGGHPRKGHLYDLHMLVNTYNGRIHGLDEISAMLSGAGLGCWQMLSLDSDSSLIVAQAGQAQATLASGDDLLILEALDMGFAQAKVINASDVLVEPWVRQKCQTGCSSYGRSLHCPPHSMKADDMSELLAGYERGLLVRGIPPGRDFHQQLLALERHCFLAGHYKALVFGAGPCNLCKECDLAGPCRLPKLARPSLEACGVNVYGTARLAGWTLEPVQDQGGYVKYLGLVLLD